MMAQKKSKPNSRLKFIWTYIVEEDKKLQFETEYNQKKVKICLWVHTYKVCGIW